jgi:D-glycero-alpha-D-manno-heptose-7-phosphate kinase
MLIVRAPLRVSLLGGGSDLPQFHRGRTGHTISCAIQKYIYITIHKSHNPKKIMLKYSKLEEVDLPKKIEHPVLKAVLSKYDLAGVDISVNSDVPSGSGLGSSSTFTVALLHAVRGFLKMSIDKHALALEACEIEIDVLGEQIGLQDQFIAAYGGSMHLTYKGERDVFAKTLSSANIDDHLENYGCLIRFVGEGNRSAGRLLRKQMASPIWESSVGKLAKLAEEYSKSNNPALEQLTSQIDSSWAIKSSLSDNVSSIALEKTMDYVRELGGTGIKLLGAGKSGYILAFGGSSFRMKLTSEFNDVMFPKIDYMGTQIIFSDEV